MGLRFVDSCSHYATDDLLKKWNRGTGAAIVETNPRRAGSKSILLDTGDLETVKITTVSYMAAGFALRLVDTWRVDFVASFVQVRLEYAAGTLSAYRGPGATLLGSADVSALLLAGEWHYIEFAALIHDSLGTIDVSIDGTAIAELTLTYLDTKPSAETGVERVLFNGAGNQLTDFYFDSAQMHGDCVVDVLYPSSVGAQIEWLPLSGANWEQVRDAGDIDDDATYNSVALTGSRDSHLMSNTPSRPGSAIKALAVTLTGRTAGPLERTVKPLLYINAVNYLHTDPGFDLALTYGSAQRIWDEHPGPTRSQWSESEVNGAEIGHELIAAS